MPTLPEIRERLPHIARVRLHTAPFCHAFRMRRKVSHGFDGLRIFSTEKLQGFHLLTCRVLLHDFHGGNSLRCSSAMALQIFHLFTASHSQKWGGVFSNYSGAQSSGAFCCTFGNQRNEGGPSCSVSFYYSAPPAFPSWRIRRRLATLFRFRPFFLWRQIVPNMCGDLVASTRTTCRQAQCSP